MVAAIVQLAIGFDVMNDGKIDWDHVTAGLVLFGIALQGVALPVSMPVFVKRE